MTALVRSASLTGLAGLCDARGVDVRALAAELGLPARALDDPDLLVPAPLVGRLLDLAAERAGEPALGVKLAQMRRLSNLGPLALLVRDEPTLRQALEAIVSRLHLHNEALSLVIEQVGNLVSIRTRLAAAPRQHPRQATELVVAVTFRVLQIFMGAEWRPRLVCFTHRAPGRLAAHRAMFGTALEFGHEFDGIVCNAADLDVANPGADPVMARYTARLLEPRVHRPATTASRVREFIAMLLPRGHCRVERVAQHLGIDRRTIARHLAADGTTFTALVDGVRDELLTRYLADGARPLGEVALMLGFSDATAFSRWHRVRFGVAASTRLR